MKLVAVAATLAVATAAGCGKVKEAKVGEAKLAYADGVDEPPEGAPTVEVLQGKTPALPEGAETVLVAADRDALFADVWPLIERARAQGIELQFLVGDRRQRLKAMRMDPAPDGTVIRVVATADGKACVSLPGVDEAKCVATAQERVDRAYTRELVREAFNAAELRRVRVEAAPGLRWSDVVRAVDGARTCCKNEKMTVGLEKY